MRSSPPLLFLLNFAFIYGATSAVMLIERSLRLRRLRQVEAEQREGAQYIDASMPWGWLALGLIFWLLILPAYFFNTTWPRRWGRLFAGLGWSLAILAAALPFNVAVAMLMWHKGSNEWADPLHQARIERALHETRCRPPLVPRVTVNDDGKDEVVCAPVGAGRLDWAGDAIVDAGGPPPVAPPADGASPIDPGSLPKSAIQGVFRAHAGELRDCYERQLSHNPRLAGRLTVAVTIDGRGAVKEAAAENDGNTLRDPRVQECLLKNLRKWTFPEAADGEDVYVRYPLDFKRAP
jgi:hypothetical protein